MINKHEELERKCSPISVDSLSAASLSVKELKITLTVMLKKDELTLPKIVMPLREIFESRKERKPVYLLDYLSNEGLDDEEMREAICMRAHQLIPISDTHRGNEQIANNDSKTNLAFDANVEI